MTSTTSRFFFAWLLALAATPLAAHAFTLQSNDLKSGAMIPDEFVYNGFGCSGANASPELHWDHPPKGAKSFAITMYDPDAPTGSGWWHWIVLNIPATTSSLPKNWKSADMPGVVEFKTDFGTAGYGGPCPPPGKVHHYHFTVYALKTDKLDVPADASHAVARFNINGNTIGKATFMATYKR